MGSMFGGFDFLGQVVQGAPMGGPPGPMGGGFPGIFPGAGVSNSGFAGLPQFLAQQTPCTTQDVVKGRCVLAPAGVLSGNKR